MKKKYLMIITTALLAVMLTFAFAACGDSSDTSSQDAQDTAQEETAATEEALHPYAWLGMQDMPQCNYLDALATSHYYRKANTYVDGMSYVGKETNAVDGINTYKDDEYNTTYSIDGKVTVINKSTKTYMEQDASDLADTAKENLENAMKTGTNLSGRAFQGTGSEAIPIYSEQEDDTAEYEYYEYNYPETEASSDNSVIERYYMKDGDVFAIYTKTILGDTEVASTDVIKSMSGDIPEGTFDLPDLSDYEKSEL